MPVDRTRGQVGDLFPVPLAVAMRTVPGATTTAPDTSFQDQCRKIEIAILDQRDVDKQAGGKYINEREHSFRKCVQQDRKITCAGWGGLGCVRIIVPRSLARLYFFWQKIMKQRRGWKEDQCERLHTLRWFLVGWNHTRWRRPLDGLFLLKCRQLFRQVHQNEDGLFLFHGQDGFCLFPRKRNCEVVKFLLAGLFLHARIVCTYWGKVQVSFGYNHGFLQKFASDG